jgi:hypothetical protein
VLFGTALLLPGSITIIVDIPPLGLRSRRSIRATQSLAPSHVPRQINPIFGAQLLAFAARTKPRQVPIVTRIVICQSQSSLHNSRDSFCPSSSSSTSSHPLFSSWLFSATTPSTTYFPTLMSSQRPYRFMPPKPNKIFIATSSPNKIFVAISSLQPHNCILVTSQ